MSETSRPIGCVIMASGLARRFGSNKLLADFGGRPLLCRALDATDTPQLACRIVVTRSAEVETLCQTLGVVCLRHALPGRNDTVRLGLEALLTLQPGLAGCIFLILCGLIPKLGALVSIMPQAVLGGAAVMMFSSIVVSGIQLITKEKMTPRTLTIVSVALGVGYGMGANASILAHTPQLFQLICGESGIVPAAFVAIVLNVLLPKDEENA